jgi:hypothetical protein
MSDGSGNWQGTSGDIRQGAFGNNGAANFAAITDGTSSSLAMGEAAGGRQKTLTSYGPWGLQGTHTCCHGRVVTNSATVLDLTAIAANCADQNFNINHDYQNNTCGGPVAANFGKSYAWNFNSLHPGGAQFVLCDGSTQFLAETIDYLTLARLAFIHDGQPTQVP